MENFEYKFQKDKIGIGRRKKSTARVFLKSGDGKIIVNNLPGEKYFQYNTIYIQNILSPLKTFELETKYDIIALTNGGGLTGQSDSIKLGIARLLCKIDSENRSVLKASGYLKRDARIKERKKYGLKKARKAPQFSKR
jgi:small subunit ribosomal protein S9|tara:strand:+ start:2821 stop:3234 length:414 start_codon:yes stop_codon:yes gene_type:complete